MLGAIAGYDPLDPASVDVPVPDYSRAFEVQTSAMRLGIPRSPFFEGLDAEVAAAVETAIGVLRRVDEECCRCAAFPRRGRCNHHDGGSLRLPREMDCRGA